MTIEMTNPQRLLLDVTATHASNLKTGIQRVTLELFKWLAQMHHGPVLPVYLHAVDGVWQHELATAFAQQLRGETGMLRPDSLGEIGANDCLLHLDLATTPVSLAHEQGLYARYQTKGAIIASIIYDLLPVRLPDCFPPVMQGHHRQWLAALSSFDGALCISQDVAGDLKCWFSQQQIDTAGLLIDWFKLGSDIGTFGGSSNHGQLKRRARLRRFGTERAKTFLMVGTIEPRKGYAQALDAFEAVWADRRDCRLIIVGREGWTHLPPAQRQTISEVVYRLEQHPERFRKLVWLSSANDAELEQAYAQADCLLAASRGEGFGLPIIEAARRGVPALARDLPVFREVAPSGTVFFKNGELATAIAAWKPPDNACTTNPASPVTWQESAVAVTHWLAHLQSHAASLRRLQNKEDHAIGN